VRRTINSTFASPDGVVTARGRGRPWSSCRPAPRRRAAGASPGLPRGAQRGGSVPSQRKALRQVTSSSSDSVSPVLRTVAAAGSSRGMAG
jgi:hypothetical protein